VAGTPTPSSWAVRCRREERAFQEEGVSVDAFPEKAFQNRLSAALTMFLILKRFSRNAFTETNRLETPFSLFQEQNWTMLVHLTYPKVRCTSGYFLTRFKVETNSPIG
jgi:hypothetical protein